LGHDIFSGEFKKLKRQEKNIETCNEAQQMKNIPILLEV
jgi:hypothetical protein